MTPRTLAPGTLGLDYSARPADDAFAAEAHRLGYRFAIRYLCRPPGRPINATKVLTPAEARALSAAGIDVGLVWQDTKLDAKRGRPGGAADALEARAQAAAAGAPPGAVIYFAVADYDAPAADLPAIDAYAAGAAANLGPYVFGAYGKRTVVEHLADTGRARHLWQAYAWSGGRLSSRATILQGRRTADGLVPAGVTIAGVPCDVNEVITADAGTWRTEPMLTIVTRSGWGARQVDPADRHPLVMPTPRLWLHHTAAEQHGPAGVRQTQAFHIDTRGWSDIGYSFLVDDDGTIYEGRGAGIVGAHTEGDNSHSHGIVAMGNYDTRQPPEALLDAVADLVAHGQRAGWWPDHLTGGHRDAPGASTACPGRYLEARLEELNHRVAARLAGSPPASTPTIEELEPMIVYPSWGRRQANGRRPMFAIVDVTDHACTVIATAGAPFAPGLDKVAAPRMTYGAFALLSTLRIEGVGGRPLGIAEAAGGVIAVGCADGGTVDVAVKPA